MEHTITTYQELQEWIALFHTDALDLLIVQGNPGSGKSSIIRNALNHIPPTEYLWLEGRLSAPTFYERLYEHRDLPIYLDDVDSLTTDKQCVNLLKCLCQTTQQKTLHWEVKRRLSDHIPPSFTTTSPLCIITNTWTTTTPHLHAVADRGILLNFQPTKEEIHAYVNILRQLLNTTRSEERRDERYNPEVSYYKATGRSCYTQNGSYRNNGIPQDHTILEESFMSDVQFRCSDEVYRFIGDHLDYFSTLSIRTYAIAEKLRNNSTSIDWKHVILSSFGLTPERQYVLELQVQYPNLSHPEKAQLYANYCKKSTRSYYRHMRFNA